MADREIEALLTLLADDDEVIAEAASRALVARRRLATEPLRTAAEGEPGPLRDRARDILAELGWDEVLAGFSRWGTLPAAALELEKGLMLVARFGCPDLDEQAVSRALDELAGRASLLADAGQEEWLAGLTTALFGPGGLQGDRDTYYEPENSYINRVLERRLGIPISLASIFLLVGRRLGAPVHGIGLPGHFLAAYGSPPQLRFVDAFNGGRELSRLEIKALLARHGLALRSEYLVPASDRAILVRTLNNLVGSFTLRGDARRAGLLTRCRDALLAPLS